MTKKIKILFAINCMNVGGAPSVVFSQMKFLDKKQFEPHLLTLYPSKAANLIGQLNFLSPERQHHFNLKKRSVFDIPTVIAIYQCLKKERFDVIYTHLFLTNLLIRTIAILLRVPVILSFEHSTYFNKSRWQIFVDRILSSRTDRIIVSTEEVAIFTSEQEDIPFSKFEVVRNPVMLPEKESINKDLLWRMSKCDKRRPLFLTIGRFSAEKGQHLLLAAARQVHDQYPEAQFLMVGHGPKENELKGYILEHEMQTYCSLLHEPERAREFLFIADWFILPSEREGQSIVVEEAMMAGLPVIASKLYGMGDAIEDGVTGFLVPSGDVVALAQQVESVLEKREEWCVMGKRAREKAESRFSNATRIARIETLLLQLTEKKGILKS